MVHVLAERVAEVAGEGLLVCLPHSHMQPWLYVSLKLCIGHHAESGGKILCGLVRFIEQIEAQNRNGTEV